MKVYTISSITKFAVTVRSAGSFTPDRTVTANFNQSVTTYVTVNISYDSTYGNWSGPLNVYAAEIQGDGYIDGASGSVKVKKGSSVNIDIQGDLYLDGVWKENAGINNIYARQNGTIIGQSYNSFSISFTANYDTSVSISCYAGD